MFILSSPYVPSGDQPEAIASLIANTTNGKNHQVLVGVTGSGKTFTIANVIEKLQLPTLVISHNKTLAGQLYQEFKEFFPKNAVSYFVSYYDYYQPEAYIPQSDTYIEKETQINEEIDKLRLAATMNILTRPDTITVASVSCIYNIGSPREYGQFVLEGRVGMELSQTAVINRLVTLQYARNDWEGERGTFRVRGDAIDIFLAYTDTVIRLEFNESHLVSVEERAKTDFALLAKPDTFVVYPAKHFMTDTSSNKKIFEQIERDMETQVETFTKQGKVVEAFRIKQRVTHDLEMIREMGYVNGIENYSRYFEERSPGDAPYTLFDYYSQTYKQWLLVIDESHMTIPQIRGMYNGDRSRKQTLIDFGFRLPAALDNRPLTFDEFLRRTPSTIYVSATPDDWELSYSNQTIVEQFVRPTGLIDPEVEVRPSTGQITDVIQEIQIRADKHERVLVTTLTKRIAEDLTEYLKERAVRVSYLHSDVETLDRSDILTDLRKGTIDVIIGVNLLREGLDLPEVSLVVILDADKEGFLRSRTSLIQTMGRAARNIGGKVILYADRVTRSMKQAMEEVSRRRSVQEEWNRKHSVTPTTISKSIRPDLTNRAHQDNNQVKKDPQYILGSIHPDELTPADITKKIHYLTQLMKESSKNLDFETAMQYRDTIRELKKRV